MLSLPNAISINLKERADTKSEIKTPKHRYVGDPMLMQASEPSQVITHPKDQSTLLAQMTSVSDKMVKFDEDNTGMIILIVILVIIITVLLICCCCYCCACCMIAAHRAEEDKRR